MNTKYLLYNIEQLMLAREENLRLFRTIEEKKVTFILMK